jgi:hypothetical protein
MLAADLGDPCLPHAGEIRGQNPELSAMAALYRRCREVNVSNGDDPGAWWTKQEVFDEIETNSEGIESFEYFMDFFQDLSDRGKLNRKRFGKFLVKWKGRQINGVTMELDESDSKATRHRVRFA